MFGLFKKQISDEELYKILGESILISQKEIVNFIKEGSKHQINDRIKDESLFFSIWSFTESFPLNRFSQRAIGYAIEQYFGKGYSISDEQFDRLGRKSIERNEVYSKTFKEFFHYQNKMAIPNNCWYLFFGNEEFSGTDIKKIPLRGMDILDAMKYQTLFVRCFNFGYGFGGDVKKKLKSEFKIKPNTID